jgi:hypothetical protein
MARKLLTTGSAQSVEVNQNIDVKGILVTAAAADVTLVLKGNGTDEVKINCKAGDSETYYAMGGTTGLHLEKPVTADVAGAGAFVRIDY